MVGGTAAFFSAYFVGPRYGYGSKQIEKPEEVPGFRDVLMTYPSKERPLFREWFLYRANEEEIKPSNIGFIVIGSFFLWVCWLFFNGGSTFDLFVERQHNTPKIIVNTILAASAAGSVANYAKPRLIYSERYHDVTGVCNGILCGLVCITGICNEVIPWVAVLIGVMGGFIYVFGVKILIICKVDDPLEASVVHGFGGAFGILFVSLFN